MFPLLRHSDAEVETFLANVSAGAVRDSLAKDRHDWFDLLNLISGAARPFVPEMRRLAQDTHKRIRRRTDEV